jgi:zinc transport system ATP-binding protein
VSVKLGGRLVLDHVDLKVLRHEIVTLVGLNGSGKTTVVRTLLGLLQPDQGSVFRLPGLKIGFSPQHFQRDATLPLTVARFLTLGMRAPRARLQTLLEEVGAGGLLERQIADISGGEFQRILLARAVLRRPDLLVLDEPLTGVDLASQSELYRGGLPESPCLLHRTAACGNPESRVRLLVRSADCRDARGLRSSSRSPARHHG